MSEYDYWSIPGGMLSPAAVSKTLGTDPDPLVKSIKYVPRADPLVLDLDGDGFEITQVNRTPPVLFDTNADTVRTATAWVSGDDGLLVLDRDGNGLIDSGRELFGDETLLSDGSKASNGFTALASLDSNADGLFSELDTQFAAVRVWRDLNQDGISQANELKNLLDSGIASIGLSYANTSQKYPDAQLQQTGSYTRSDGTSGQAGSFLFATNSFMREFLPISVNEAAQALPDISGSGWTRDLQEAATLAPILIDLISAAKNAATRNDYKQAVGDLLREWADSSDYQSAGDQALTAGYGLIMSEPLDDQERGWMDVAVKATKADRQAFRAGLSAEDLAKFDAMRERMVGGLEKLAAYEAFTGFTFLSWGKVFDDAFFTRAWTVPNGVPIEVWVPLSQRIAEQRVAAPAAESGYIRVTIPAAMDGSTPHLTMLWDRLVSDSVDNLMPTLRLGKYLDQIELVIGETDVSFNFTSLNATLLAERAANPVEGVAVLLDLFRLYGQEFDALGWNGTNQAREMLNLALTDSDVRSGILNSGFNFYSNGSLGSDLNDAYMGDSTGNVFSSETGADLLDGAGGDDTLDAGFGNDIVFGGSGSDLLFGRDGIDLLQGEDGNDQMRGGGGGADTLLGGAGNDTLYGNDTSGSYPASGNNDTYDGGTGNDAIEDQEASDGDVYRLNLGGGQDSVRDDGGVGDRIELGAGITTSQVTVRHNDGNLIVKLADGSSITSGMYNSDTGAVVASREIEEVRFADGTVWAREALKLRAQQGSDLADRMFGFDTNDVLTAGAGDDQVWTRNGDDQIDLGDGNDQARGGIGADTLLGGAGNDTLYGNDTSGSYPASGNNDTYDGGTGNDAIEDQEASDGDVYRLNLGGGQDSVRDDGGVGDRIELGAGITTSQVTVRHNDGNLIVKLADGSSITSGMYNSDTGAVTGREIEEIHFADGTTWDRAEIKLQALQGSDVADRMFGFDGDDVLNAGGGDDLVWTRNGDDQIDLGDGNDQARGGIGADTLLGGAGNDTLYGNDTTGSYPAAGNNDTYDGGTGNDAIEDQEASDGDVYRLNLGGGQDSVRDDGGVGDRIELGAGITTSQVTVRHNDGNLIVKLADGSSITSGMYNSDTGAVVASREIEEVRFADGTVWDREALKLRAQQGSDLADRMFGFDTNDVLTAGAGDDLVWTRNGDDQIDLGDGNDQARGGIGADTLLGGAGNDTLYGNDTSGSFPASGNNDTYDGGAGNDAIEDQEASDGDVYRLNLGGGQDSVRDDGGVGDRIELGAGITTSQVTVRHNDGNLIVKLADGSSITSGMYNSDTGAVVASREIEEVRFADGTVWDREALKLRAQQGSNLADRMFGFDTSDVLTAGAGDDLVWTRNGDDQIDLGDGNDQARGGIGADTLLGGMGNDTLYGNDTSGSYPASGNNDTYDGGAGNDAIEDQEASDGDVYRLNLGGGQDSVRDDGGIGDRIEVGAGIAASQLVLTKNASSLVATVASTGESLTVSNFFSGSAAATGAVEEIRFADGTSWNGATILARATSVAPVVASPIADQIAPEDAAFSFQIPANAFTDADAGQVLSYSALLADGSSLPSWLAFDAVTRTFSGTPGNAQVGAVQIKVTATDPLGLSATDVFAVTVTNTNDAPTLTTAVSAQAATQGLAFNMTVPVGTFADADAGDTLSYGLTRADGSALPAWLSFNATTRVLSGTPNNGDVGTIGLKLTGTDAAGAAASTSFNLVVANANDAPVLSVALADQAGQAGAAFSYTVPVGAFTDIDVGDTLTYSAKLADGSALPAWLSFNATTRSFSGTQCGRYHQRAGHCDGRWRFDDVRRF